MSALIFLIIHWFIALFCQSFFLHRYCAHKMYKMNFFWERFFYILTYISLGPSFLTPRSYSIMHQKHHAHSDTQKDPHSPHHTSNILSLMRESYSFYAQIEKSSFREKEIKHHYPEIKRLDKFASTHWNTLLWVPLYIFIYSNLDISFFPWAFVMIPIHCMLGPIQGIIVNWCGHYYGYRNYETKDNSKNTFKIDLPLLGELYQNNHHRFCQKINFAHKWYEIDLTYIIAKFLNTIRVITIRRTSL